MVRPILLNLFYRWLNLLEHYTECNSVLNIDSAGILKNSKNINYLKTIAGKINRYFCQFLELLNQPMESFKCCGNPEIITLDGIVISIEAKRIRAENLNYPWIIGTSNKRYFFNKLILLN